MAIVTWSSLRKQGEKKTTGCAGTCGGSAHHAAGHGALGGPGLLGLNRDVKFLLLGDFRQLLADDVKDENHDDAWLQR